MTSTSAAILGEGKYDLQLCYRLYVLIDFMEKIKRRRTVLVLVKNAEKKITIYTHGLAIWPFEVNPTTFD